ncbi:MAG: SDR family oxidoreductase [Acidobacteria bacterium]|nr:SDR family oxidoreductase [Acidobacteriota bacterium]
MTFVLKDRWALITGASSGIGAALARELASRGTHCILVARRQRELDGLAKELSGQFKVEAKAIALDLTHPDAVSTLLGHILELPVSVLVNNAGVGVTGPFHMGDPEALSRMIQLNVCFMMQLTHAMWTTLAGCEQGSRILNVGSIAGAQGVPHMAAYAATKAFVNHLSQGLTFEQPAHSKLRITCLMPGKTESEFFDVAGMRNSRFVSSNVMSPRDVARIGIDAMVKGKAQVVAGWLNRLSVWSGRFSPTWLLRWTMRHLFRDMGVN